MVLLTSNRYCKIILYFYWFYIYILFFFSSHLCSQSFWWNMISYWFFIRIKKVYAINKNEVTAVHTSIFYLQVKPLIPIKFLHVLSLYDLSELLNEIVLFRKPNKPLNSPTVSNRASTVTLAVENIPVIGILNTSGNNILFCKISHLRCYLLSCMPSVHTAWRLTEWWQENILSA